MRIGKKKTSIIVFIVLAILLIYTRFVNLGWSLPYPMHPDERNMVTAILQFDCMNGEEDCFHPHFFAYGQFPLYLAYFITLGFHFFDGDIDTSVSFEEAAIALRLISAASSVIMSVLLLLIFRSLLPRKHQNRLLYLVPAALLIIFTPAFIQFAHYGTTESLLMVIGTALLYLSIERFQERIRLAKYCIISAVLCGVGLASKISALPFLVIPAITVIATLPYYVTPKEFSTHLVANIRSLLLLILSGVTIAVITVIIAVVLSPYNLIELQDFLSSMDYESAVGFGTYKAFYTRQFEMTTPVVFQLSHVLPFVFGLPVFVLSLAGFFVLSWKRREYNFLRVIFLLLFIPQAVVYAKWTRFVSPAFPVLLLFGMVFAYQLFAIIEKKRWGASRVRMGVAGLLLGFAMLPGIALLRVYIAPDVRYQASEWMFENIEDGAYILAETANVIDLPIVPPGETIPAKNFTAISFDSYNVDNDYFLQQEFQNHIEQADYIIVPTRRVFANHTCEWPDTQAWSNQKALITIPQYIPLPDPLNPKDIRCEWLEQEYPILNEYYRDLFSGELGFEPVAEFSSYPAIELFGVTLISFPDERAEETWTVFDHPVVRIYKRVK